MALLKYCSDCEESQAAHWRHWIDVFFQLFIPEKFIVSYRIDQLISALVLNMSVVLRLGHFSDSYTLKELSPRLAYFIEAARTQGLICHVLKIGNHYTEHLKINYRGRNYYFQSYPTASHFDGPLSQITSDKAHTKQHLQKAGFPVARGKAYYFWQKERAIKESIAKIGFPLVVKPVNGTFSRHVTTDIRDEKTLYTAIGHAVAYQPSFLIERYITRGTLHRVTVIDFHVVAVAQELPPQVVGNGHDTVAMLVQQKNQGRHESVSKDAHTLLREISLESIPPSEAGRVPKAGEIVTIHKNPFIRLGADLIGKTQEIEASNVLLCESIARYFGIHCAGIDLFIENIGAPWQQQQCSILEINDLPSIEMHSQDASIMQNLANALVHMFIKYYGNK